MHAEFLFEKVKGRDHSEDINIKGRIILEWNDLRAIQCKLWTGFNWLRIETNDGLLLMQ
jgi:hypothetical protein